MITVQLPPAWFRSVTVRHYFEDIVKSDGLMLAGTLLSLLAVWNVSCLWISSAWSIAL